MRLDVITLFPEMFAPFLKSGVVRRAFVHGGAIQLRLWPLRDFATDAHRRIDDRPFGGGPGMVMQAEPLARCVEAVWENRQDDTAPVVLFSPQGERLTHTTVARWAQDQDGAILVCGRYEGVDQRFITRFVTTQISLGDFVLSGGEIAALAFLDAVARLQPGVLNDSNSSTQDSFHPALHGLLDCPHYTRPEVWRNQGVPAVLLNGNHAAIAAWRKMQSMEITSRLRPDLLPESNTEQGAHKN